MALLVSIITFAQGVTVKGVVIDETDIPLIGATVQVKGGQAGAATDLDGNFTLTANKNATLVVSYIGYLTQEVKIQGKTQLTIKLVPDSKTLDEVVVVGYGTMKKSDLTGSVSSVSAKDVEGFQTSSIAGALGGQIAGVQITSTDGTPGAGFNISIRGVGTLTGDASPLYIVDGFEVSDIDYLSNSDIESIQVLKDASSSAIYGARAANGVVLITTKSGKSGKPVVTYNGSATYRKISKTLDLLSPYEFVKLQGEVKPELSTGYYKEGNDEDGTPYRYQSLEDYIGLGGVDWQGETFNPTWSQDHNLSLIGGNDNTKYNASFSRYIENGIFKNSGFDKTTAKFRLDQKINKKVSFNVTVNYAQTNRKGAGTSADSGRFNMLAQILSARPTGGLKLTDEALLNSAIDPEMLETGESLAQVNPVKQTESVTNNKRAEMWSANGALTWDIIKGLTFKTAGTYNTTNNRIDIFYRDGSKEAYRNGQKPYGRTQMGRDVRWSNNNTLTWKQKIQKHNYDIMLGHEVSYRNSEHLLGEAMDFPFDNLGNNNLGLGAVPSKVESGYNEKMLLSFFARAAGDAASLADEGKLALVLDLAQAGDGAAHAFPLHAAHALAQRFKGAHGYKIVLIIQGVDAGSCAQLAHDVLVAFALPGHEHLKAGRLRLGLLGIAEIRHDGGRSARRQHQSLARVAGQVEHIAGVIDQHALVLAQTHGVKEPFYTFCQCRSLTYGRFGTQPLCILP